ncbi:MAG: tetraacyldisaccharide 4'-kinase [Bacteroidales bacterium]|nr:tetraacyldisaccharide 4'-kinase [Bacteroidales bacterium]
MEAFRFLLFPFAVLYGFIIKIRNKLFDVKIFPSEKFNIPVISVGNLIAGGSGKTPMVEYLIRLLDANTNLATLSRGYKRKTKGYRLAGENETVDTLGDEPVQYLQKFTDINVAVCENRREGIRTLIKDIPDLEIVILDDAFQHRYVKPELSILVTDYFKLFTKDWLLPFGRLREHISGRKRADIIVVTKTPRIFSPIVRKQLLEEIKPYPGQLVCFSYINYLPFETVYKTACQYSSKADNVYSIIMVTGIGNPGPMQEYLRRMCTDLELMEFSDHHEFNEKDLLLIKDKFKNLPTKRKIIVTTEKDAKRLQNAEAEAVLGDLPIFYAPINFEFHPADKMQFDEAILAAVKSGIKKDADLKAKDQ